MKPLKLLIILLFALGIGLVGTTNTYADSKACCSDFINWPTLQKCADYYCSDGIDNDGDGFKDCNDEVSCISGWMCTRPAITIPPACEEPPTPLPSEEEVKEEAGAIVQQTLDAEPDAEEGKEGQAAMAVELATEAKALIDTAFPDTGGLIINWLVRPAFAQVDSNKKLLLKAAAKYHALEGITGASSFKNVANESAPDSLFARIVSLFVRPASAGTISCIYNDDMVCVELYFNVNAQTCDVLALAFGSYTPQCK